MRRSRLPYFLVAVSLACVVSASASESPESLRITALGNEGFLIANQGSFVIVDDLIRHLEKGAPGVVVLREMNQVHVVGN